MSYNESLQPLKIPLYKALTQPILIAGAERELSILIGFMAAIVWVAGKDLLSFVLALSIWFIGNAMAQAATKEESQRIKIFSRHVKYKIYYPATEKIDAPRISIKSFK